MIKQSTKVFDTAHLSGKPDHWFLDSTEVTSSVSGVSPSSSRLAAGRCYAWRRSTPNAPSRLLPEVLCEIPQRSTQDHFNPLHHPFYNTLTAYGCVIQSGGFNSKVCSIAILNAQLCSFERRQYSYGSKQPSEHFLGDWYCHIVWFDLDLDAVSQDSAWLPDELHQCQDESTSSHQLRI